MVFYSTKFACPDMSLHAHITDAAENTNLNNILLTLTYIS
uniref:Uncharacterized protein n=1 Tax=Arundo donax TaxID=35708 RepID=A0A0A9A8P2_ARUDO